MRTTNIRFTGLASGLDTESLVEALSMPYKSKVDKAKKQQTLLEWQKDAWRDMNNNLNSFYTNTLGKFRMNSAFEKKSVTVSHTDKIEIKNSSKLPEGTHTIKNITNLAEGARLETDSIKHTDGTTLAQKKDTLGELGIVADGDKYVIKVTDEENEKGEIVVTQETTISQLENMLKKQLTGSNVNFDESVGAFFISSKKTGENQKIELESYKLSADVDVVEGKIDENYLDEQGKIKGEYLSLDKDATILKGLQLGTANGDGKISIQGQNAELMYNGIKVSSETNNISINGLEFTIKAKATEEITVVASTDIGNTMDAIKEFVDSYNSLIDELYSKMNADRAKGYEPLTDEEKAAMSEDEIKKWEAKIQDGLFSNSPELREVVNDMRNILGTSLGNGTFKNLQAIGITTGDWRDNGKLQIDEEKLRKALEEDANSVIQLFAGKGEEKGLVDKLYDNITMKTKSTKLRSSFSFYNDKLHNENIRTKKEEVSKLATKLTTIEDMYYKKFTAMEKMMSQLNSQSNFLSSQL